MSAVQVPSRVQSPSTLDPGHPYHQHALADDHQDIGARAELETTCRWQTIAAALAVRKSDRHSALNDHRQVRRSRRSRPARLSGSSRYLGDSIYHTRPSYAPIQPWSISAAANSSGIRRCHTCNDQIASGILTSLMIPGSAQPLTITTSPALIPVQYRTSNGIVK